MNQPPPREKQTGKRIVSKGAYAAQLFRISGWGMVGISMLLLALFIFWYALNYAFFSVMHTAPVVCSEYGGCKTTALPGVAIAGLIASLSLACAFATQHALKAASNVPLDKPITRANTAHLPAPDTLVRASEEPRQEQAVLLRAATEASERHEEQLVRASAGTE